jgi:hypothetical protein
MGRHSFNQRDVFSTRWPFAPHLFQLDLSVVLR